MRKERSSPRAGISRRDLLKLMAAGGMAGLAPFGRLLASPEELRLRQIPSSGESLPVVGLGTSRVFDVGSDELARAPLAEVLRVLVEHGASVVDTSPMYGRAEGVVGDLSTAAGLGERLFVATKVWTRGREQGIAQMESSFRLLGVDTVDLMQVHNLVDWRTQLKTLRGWKEEGKIRYLGITHYRVDAFDELESLMRDETLDFVQLNFSIATPDAEQRLLPLAAERGIAVLVNRPYERGQTFARVRGKDLPGWAGEIGVSTWGQFFLKWVLAQPAVTCVIPGTSRPKHMLDNLQAGMGPLPDEDQRRRMREFFLA
ncbi:MAG: aldo/keto reductase [Gammaproteobacteria bacterium]|jgi:diketogulonate reductase-like aldo/keto reductase